MSGADKGDSEGDDLHRLVVENSPYCIHRIGLDRKLASMNRAGLTMMGVESEAAVTGTEYLATVDAADRPRISELLDAALGGEASEFEFTAANGLRLLSTFVPMLDAEGAVVSLMGVTQDITERVAAAEALRRSEEKLQLALAAGDMGVWEYNFETDTVSWSARGYAMHGVDPEGDFGHTLGAYLDLVHPEDRAALAERFATASEVPGSYHSEHRVLRPSDGTLRWIQGVGRAEHAEGGAIMNVVGTILDVTERVQRDEQLRQTQQLESLGVLAGGIAHDFNNLLVGILGHADCALDELEGSSPVAASLAEIIRSSERAAELCQQMLAYSGRAQFVVGVHDPRALVEEMASLLDSSVPKGVGLERAFAEDTPRVKVDPTQIRQVVMNLITNAAEAVEPQSGSVTLRTARVEVDEELLRLARPPHVLEPGTYACIAVCDDGEGMSRDMLATMFDPFSTTKAQGRGLGLAAVLGIVSGHGGAVVVESKPEEGTCFRVLLPTTEEALPQSAPRAEEPTFAPATILVVDDEDTVRRVARRCLAQAGYSVVMVESGEDALAYLDSRPDEIDAVLLDLTMPGMGGAATHALLRERHSGLPVVLTSGFSEMDVLASVGDQVPFIQKPYRSKTLRDVFVRVLHGS